ncbi:MAG: universal stress protein [Desulfatitalea sp.]
MLKILVYTDGTPATYSALHFAAELKKRCLEAELAVITVRSGTHAAEEPPPVGREIPLSQAAALPKGPRILIDALAILAAEAVLDRPLGITLRDMPKGHMFVCKGPDGARIPFYESFGPFVETLNREVDEHAYDLLVVAPPRHGKLGRIVRGDTTRKLALDLNTSLLVVRGGGPASRYLVCADGSVAARRQFPLLRQLLPAIGPPVDLMCVQEPSMDAQSIKEAQECLQHARDWLAACGKQGAIVMKAGTVPAEEILTAAGHDSVIVMGASLRHDIYRRMLGSLPMQIMARTAASVLLVKRPPEAGADFMKDPLACR